MKKIFLFSIFLSLCSFYLKAQDSTNTDDKKVPKKGDIYFSPVPVIGVNPAFGFIYGVGASTSWFMGDPKTTKISNALAGLAFTSKKQTVMTIKSAAYLQNDEYILLGDWRYLNSSQPTFGVGTGPQSAKLGSNGFVYDENTFASAINDPQLMTFKFIRFYQTALKKVNKDFYAGIGYHLDYYNDVKSNMLDLSSTPKVITSDYAYNFKNGFAQDKSVLSGISFNGIYDTRDNQNCPYKGRYAYLSFTYNPTFIGSDQNSSLLWLEYRDYFNLTPDHHNILAFWAFGNFTTSGKVPYLDLPALGWDQFSKSGRGYVQGRFRGDNLVYSEVEYRKHIWGTTKSPDLLGAVAFLNVTTASSELDKINLFEYLNTGFGVGLRVMMSKKARSKLTVDYAWGNYNSSGFYIRINETF